MPQYFFDIFDGIAVSRDDHGDVFDSLEDASDQAAGLVADIAREKLQDRRGCDFAVAMRDGDGQDVYRAVLVFRDTYPDPNASPGLQEPCASMSVPDPADLIRRSREARATARGLVRQTGETAATMTEILRQNISLLTQVRALVAGLA